MKSWKLVAGRYTQKWKCHVEGVKMKTKPYVRFTTNRKNGCRSVDGFAILASSSSSLFVITF